MDSRKRPQRSGDQVRVAHLVSGCSQVLADFPVTTGKVVTIPNGNVGTCYDRDV